MGENSLFLTKLRLPVMSVAMSENKLVGMDHILLKLVYLTFYKNISCFRKLELINYLVRKRLNSFITCNAGRASSIFIKVYANQDDSL